jgi:predicted Holliday junction resolvase-like endonuclease
MGAKVDNIYEFFSIQRRVFGLCPKSGRLFRLSDCKVYLKTKPTKDWMDRISDEEGRLSKLDEELDGQEESLREIAREKGRKTAQKLIRVVDTVFTPKRLNPDDAKVLFHPVDYVLFKGMKCGGGIKEIAFLDRETKSRERRTIQRSIEKTIERGHYEWLTIRVSEDGSIKEES